MSEAKTRAERIALKVRRKQRLVRVALGEEKADVVLKNADYVNVFSGTVEHGDIAVANGLVVGMADHYDGLMEVDVSGNSAFTDVAADAYYAAAVAWAEKNGVTGGIGGGLFGSGNTCTRAQIVTFLYRAMK